MRVPNYILFTVMAISMPVAAWAQNQAQTLEPASQPKSTTQKARKVWTNDDINSPQSGERNLAQTNSQPDAEPAATAEDAKSKTPIKPAAAPPRLSNPKTVAAAEQMIAWEQRDIDSQQEFVAQLHQQLFDAPADQRAHLQEVIEQRNQIIADTVKERDTLVAQKHALEKTAPPGQRRSHIAVPSVIVQRHNPCSSTKRRAVPHPTPAAAAHPAPDRSSALSHQTPAHTHRRDTAFVSS